MMFGLPVEKQWCFQKIIKRVKLVSAKKEKGYMIGCGFACSDGVWLYHHPHRTHPLPQSCVYLVRTLTSSRLYLATTCRNPGNVIFQFFFLIEKQKLENVIFPAGRPKRHFSDPTRSPFINFVDFQKRGSATVQNKKIRYFPFQQSAASQWKINFWFENCFC